MKKTVKIILAASIFTATSILLLYLIAFFIGKPDLNSDRYLKLYDDQNEIFYQSINNYSGQYVSLNDVSHYFQEAIVAIEDQRFYEHHGFDIIGIARAVKTNITRQKNAQGASTITQQYARLLYLTNEKTWSRKIKEAFYTMQLESHLSKKEILEGYVNNVYFGHGIYGIENASQYFFNKSARTLTLNEASMLAGVVNGPQYYSPLIDETNAKKRQLLVLNAMLENGYITKKQLNTVKKEKLILSVNHEIQENMSSFYYKDTVIDELESLGYYNNQYLNKGLNVYTTYHSEYQDVLNQSIKDKAMTSKLQCAFVVVDPQTSSLQALVGGMDYSTSQFNRATKATRQIGSTVKPLLYYLALENGFDATTQFMCEPTTFQLDDNASYAPQNFHNKYAYKNITLAQAIAVSDNIYAMKTHLFLGTEHLYHFLKQYDIDCKNNASLALGTVNSNIYELANIYTNIAAKGSYQQIYTIERIEDDEGNTLYLHEDQRRQTLSQDSCLELSQLLTGTFDSQFSTYLSATMASYDPEFTVACKTGSTDYDNLIVAYAPEVLIAGWTGYDDNTPMENSEEKSFAKEIAMSFLQYRNEKKALTWYQPTRELIAIAINPLTGQNDENGTVYWFKKEDYHVTA